MKFAYVDIILIASKMFRGTLTAVVLAIEATVVLISEIEINCHTINIFKHVSLIIPYVILQIADYQGDNIKKAIWEVLQLWCVVINAHFQWGNMHVFD